ncbi:MAG: putative glycoside hydrolase [Pseudomonadota bacterium]
MKLIKLAGLFSLACVITACGGNGNKVNNPGSIAKSSVAAVNTNCATYTGAVFIDSVCSPWRKPSIFEMNSITSVRREITDTNIGEGLSFNIIDSKDAGHHQVLDIHYADQTIVNGVAHIFAPESASNSLDMSEYATGKLIFDIKVINEGTAKPDIELTVECGWPCASTPEIIKPVALNQWQTVEISVAKMISRGLDITKVDTAFLLSPTWGEQANAHYQLDNIRWEKGSAVTPTTSICYANYLDDPWISDEQGILAMHYSVDDSVVDFLKTNVSSTTPFVTIKPDWSFFIGRWALSLPEAMDFDTFELIKPSTLTDCSTAGVLSMELYIPKSYVDDGQLTFTLHFRTSNHQAFEIPGSQFDVAFLKPDEWNKISVDLSENLRHEDLMYVGLTFDSRFINPTINDVLKIDNIVITHSN